MSATSIQAADMERMTLDELLEAADFAPTYALQVAYINAFFARWTAGTTQRQA